MKQKQIETSDGKIVTKKAKEPIPENCIHIYVGKRTAIGLSRKFKPLLEDMNVMMLKKTKDQHFDHPNLGAMISVKNNILKLAIYTSLNNEVNCYIHNFMVVKLPADVRKTLNSTFETMVRVKATAVETFPPRRPETLFLEFDLETTALVGHSQYDARKVFAK